MVVSTLSAMRACYGAGRAGCTSKRRPRPAGRKRPPSWWPQRGHLSRIPASSELVFDSWAAIDQAPHRGHFSSRVVSVSIIKGSLVVGRLLGRILVRLGLVRLVMADGASCRRAKLPVACHVPGHPADHGALDASLGFRRTGGGERDCCNASGYGDPGRSPAECGEPIAIGPRAFHGASATAPPRSSSIPPPAHLKRRGKLLGRRRATSGTRT
jgi:hypothetical protein